MSLLRGEPGSSWTLPSSVDAVAAAARQAGRPGMIWVAGIAYQFVVLGWTFGSLVVRPLLGARVERDLPVVRIRPLHGMEEVLEWVQREGLLAALASAPVVLLLFRLAGGLARLSPDERWRIRRGGRRPPLLWHAWRAGRGTTLSGIGLWLLFVMMMVAATLLFAGPTHLLLAAAGAQALSPLRALVWALTIGLLLLYGFLLSILFQLGLHSLVQNRRGAGSALQHAWRIARNDPLATTRATIVDAILYLTVLLLLVAALLVQQLLHLPEAVLYVPHLALIGFFGCARSAFWARAYVALGGISTLAAEDGEDPGAGAEGPAAGGA